MHWRDELVKLLRQHFSPTESIVGIEHGVWMAKTSQKLLSAFPKGKLYGVDKYDPQVYATDSKEPMKRYPQRDWTIARDTARSLAHRNSRFALFSSRPPYTADYVFIDGNHSYEAVINDSHWYWPYVVLSGLMIWHDYGNNSPHTTGVKLAVDAFCKDVKTKLNVIPETTIAWTRKVPNDL